MIVYLAVKVNFDKLVYTHLNTILMQYFLGLDITQPQHSEIQMEKKLQELAVQVAKQRFGVVRGLPGECILSRQSRNCVK